MSGEAECPAPPLAPPAPPPPNLLLYVTPPHHPGTPSIEDTNQFAHLITDRKSHIKDEIIGGTLRQVRYQPSYPNGLAIQKNATPNVISIENSHNLSSVYACKPARETGHLDQIPNIMNEAFAGVRNIGEGQRLLPREMSDFIHKEKSENIGSNPTVGCGDYLEMNQERVPSGRMMMISRSDSARSETGESCSSLSSGDSQYECSSSMVILQDRMSNNNIHSQRATNHNQIVLNQNAGIMNQMRSSGNVVIANQIDNSQSGQNPITNFQIVNNQSMQQHSMITQNMNMMNQHIMSNRNVNISVMETGNGCREAEGGSGEHREGMTEGDGTARQALPLGMEGDIVIVNNMPHQLVRTSSGIVLSMLPAAKHSAVGASVSVGVGVVNSVSAGANIVQSFVPCEGRQVTVQSPPEVIVIPFGWDRIVDGNNVYYISPSGAVLCSIEHVREYLQSSGTCKCGLDCPLKPEATFNFDPKVMGKPSESRFRSGEARHGCGAKRRAGPPSPSPAPPPTPPSPPADDKQRKVVTEMPAAKKRKRKGNPYSGVSVSQLLAQRENLQQQQVQQQHQVQQQQHQQQMQQQQMQQQHLHQQQLLQSQHMQQHNQKNNLQQNMWTNSPNNININSSHPHHSASPTMQQMRLNGPAETNFLNRNIIMRENSPSMLNQGSHQMNKLDGALNPIHSGDFHSNSLKPNFGAQVLTINGSNLVNPSHNSPESNQRLVQSHLVLSPQQPGNIGTSAFISNGQNNINFSGMNHIIGPNGQIIEIQASNISRSQSLGNVFNNEKGNISPDGSAIKSELVPSVNQNCIENTKGNIPPTQNHLHALQNGPVHTTQPQNNSNTNMIGETNIQQLTPEVIQRINQQQQIFIQQNQKQMELAMKGIKTHIVTSVAQQVTGNKPNTFSDVTPQGNPVPNHNQMGMPTNQMMGNQRVPPWQLNRINKFPQQQYNQMQSMQFINKQNQPSRQNQIEITSQSFPFQGSHNISVMENTTSNVNPMIAHNVGNQNIYSRVPPLHHHTPPATWPEEVQKKKSKPSKNAKKSRIQENQRINSGNHGASGQNTFNNVDLRPSSHSFRTGQMQNSCGSPLNPSPSFMEDPSGYLAQQTALLNNTISRQVGLHPMNSSSPVHNNSSTKNNNPHINLKDGNNSSINSKSYAPRNNNMSSSNVDQENRVQNNCNISFNNSPTQSNIPDSSINCDKSSDSIVMQQAHSHCQGCIAEMNETTNNELSGRNSNSDDSEQRLRNSNFQSKMQTYIESFSSLKSESCSQPGTPSPNQCSDESPVTSSTYGERPGSRSNNHCSDSRGPIQGGIISTSNGSPMESYQLPELSPTPSNSSRNTDTPQSKNSGSGYNISSSCPFTNPSPAYSNNSSYRESINSNPATPSPGNMNQNYISHSSPDFISNNGSNQSVVSSSQMISDSVHTHSYRMNCFNDSNSPMSNSGMSNVILSNDNMLMNLDQSNNNQRIVQSINGSTFYVPPNMAAGSANVNRGNNMMFIPSNGVVTTMASGHTLSRNTITSVLAGKAQTATTSINATVTGMPYIYPAATNTNNTTNCSSQSQNDHFSQMNTPANYPLHVAGTVAQSLVSKSPLEMVQSVVSGIQVSQNQSCSSGTLVSKTGHSQGKTGNGMNPGHIVVPSNGQFVITGTGQGTVMAPPPPKGQPLPPISASPHVTSVTASMSQAIPAVGGVPQVLNHPTVLVNTLPAPFMLQPQMVTVDGQMVNQNVQMPQIVTGNIISQGQAMDSNNSQDFNKNLLQKTALLSPDSGKKKGKKRKPQNQVPTSMMQITTHSPNNVLVQHSSQQQSQHFPSQSFQMSPNGNISTAPMLQALTIVPGKAGAPAHIVMNGQAAGNFGSQQIITNSQGAQHINLLQPVNLLNGTTGVVQNFPTFQQFIVPGLGGMVMTADGTAILQDTSNMPMQLQIQNVNGQNVLTPIQNQGILTAGPTGMVIRTQNSNNKMMQSQHSPGAQFLSPGNGQIVMGGSPFSGQLSPLVASMSPNHTVTFNGSPPQVRSNIQQEFLQCNQMGQTLMLPLSPNQINVSSSANQQNTTYVQQNTTIVQQQTTMVSNNNNQFQNNGVNSTHATSINLDQGVMMSQNMKQNNQVKARNQNILQIQNHPQQITIQNPNDGPNMKRIALQYPHMINQMPQMNGNMKNDAHIQQIFANINQNNMLNQQQNSLNPHVRHSVSTQTLVNQQNGNKSPPGHISGSSPPDTTTHSPLGSSDGSSSSPPGSMSSSPNSSHGNLVDTTTGSPEPNEQGSLAMVHCVSSSEPDSMENNQWAKKVNEKVIDIPGNTIHINESPSSQNTYYNVDSSGIHFSNQTITVSSLNNQQNLTITPVNYYPKNNSSKHNSNQNTITLMPNMPQTSPEKISKSMGISSVEMEGRHVGNQISSTHGQNEKMQHTGRNMNSLDIQRSCNNIDISANNMKRISVSSANESSTKESAASVHEGETPPESQWRDFKEGDLVWGPAKGYPAWPGKLVTKNQVNGKEDGKVLVRWFGGDKCLTVVDAGKLQTLSEGLEAHHAARTKCRKSRKLNGQLEKAIQEAMAELDRITESRERRRGNNRYDNSIHKMDIEIADINGNSSKPFLKSTVGKNNGKISEVSGGLGVKGSDVKTKSWSSKKESKPRPCVGGVVKIAPHPGSTSSSEVAGRLRSSQR